MLKLLGNLINHFFFSFFSLFPINDKQVVLESDGDLSDNSFALYDYMQKNGYLKNYKIIWLIYDRNNVFKKKNVSFAIKKINTPNPKMMYSLATCKFYIYDHSNYMSSFKKRKGQFIIYLSHGCGVKGPKNSYNKAILKVDEIYVTGKLFIPYMSEFYQIDEKCVLDIGYPRLDYLFQTENKFQIDFKKKYKLNSYKKIFLWMPTFRQSSVSALSENYIANETGLPIFETSNSLKEFNKFLKDNDSLCLLKVHHLQATLDIFRKKLSNIIILSDKEVQQNSLQLYQIIGMTDALITDYSSISTDYLLLNKPIVYTMDDYEEYKKSRGFYPPDPIDLLVGYHVYSQKEMDAAILEVIDGKDIYKNDRSQIVHMMHSFTDGNASKRILDHLGISVKQ